MRTIGFILQKEFLQIFRNRAMLPIIFVMPVVQLLLLSFAATFDVNDVPVSVVDHDMSMESRRLVSDFEASGYFVIQERPPAAQIASESMLRGDVQMVIEIPRHFSRDLGRTGISPVQFVVDAQDGATAGIIQAYASQILGVFGNSLLKERGSGATAAGPGLVTTERHWYNPGFKYTTYMVPGILVVLVTMIALFLSSMNVVREKEIGTIEQLNVTPIRKYQFIIGKLLPFWILALVELAVGLLIARLVFSLPMLGSLPLVFFMAAIYLLVMLGIGLWISTLTSTQQQAMFIAWFFIVIFILLSGLFTPVESMPLWAQRMNMLNPIAYFIDIMRRILLMGAGMRDVIRPAMALAVYAAVALTLAVSQYRKVTT